MISLRLYAFLVCAAGLAFGGYALLRPKPKTAEELEHERRTWLNTVGRITDGTVIDVQELSDHGKRDATMLIYQYDVAGVSYEAAGRHLPSAVDQSAFLPAGTAHFGEVRFAESWEFNGDCGRVDWAAAVGF